MHLETAHPQCLEPRLPQRLVRRYAIQSVQVLQAEAAADQRTDQTADCAAHGAADACGPAQLGLGRLIAPAIGLFAATLVGAAWWGRWRWRRRGFMFISVWHDPFS
jgi:hypothetical protein